MSYVRLPDNKKDVVFSAENRMDVCWRSVRDGCQYTPNALIVDSKDFVIRRRRAEVQDVVIEIAFGAAE